MSFSTILQAGFMTMIQDKALPVIKADRNRYENVWKIITDYCKENQLIISDKYTLMQKADTIRAIYEKSYKIYTTNPFLHANNLVNLIHAGMINEPSRKFLRMKTVKEQEEFVIEYDMRIIVNMYKLQKYKSADSKVLVKPDYIDGLLYLPAEIELIDVYHDLYTMVKYDDNIADEATLFAQVVTRKEQGILGAGDCKNKRKNIIEAFKIDLVKNWLPHQRETILIGPWMYDVIKLTLNGICRNFEKIQLISTIKPQDMLNKVQHYATQYGSFEVTMREQDLNIPKDFRTSRYTYYIKMPDESHKMTEKPFLDLFNCADFEIIPYFKHESILLANKWVSLRFLFIDLWVIRIIKSLGLLSDDILNKKIANIWQCIEYFRCDRCENKIDGYIGTYRDYGIDKKLSIFSQNKRFFPYYPDVYLNDNNEYREIA